MNPDRIKTPPFSAWRIFNTGNTPTIPWITGRVVRPNSWLASADRNINSKSFNPLAGIPCSPRKAHNGRALGRNFVGRVVRNLNIHQSLPLGIKYCRRIVSFKKNNASGSCIYLGACLYAGQDGFVRGLGVDYY